MVSGAVIAAGKQVVGKIAEQVAIQAAAELLLRRIMGRSGGREQLPQGHQNPIDDLELSAMMRMAGGGIGAIEAPKKRKVSKYNRLVKKYMKELSKKRRPGKAKDRFKKAVKMAVKENKRGKKKSK